jgi:hypothetical protein
MKKFGRVAALAGLASLYPQTALADFACEGTPTGIFTNGNGAVTVQMPWRQDWVGICNVKTSWKGIDPSVCWAWFAHLSTAVAEHKPIIVYYADPSSCTTIPLYESSPAPYYVRLNTQ